MDPNKTIQSLWIGHELSPMEIMCIKSYLSHSHQFHLYIYNEVKNIPNGTTIKDANEIIPQNECFVDEFGGFVNLSNRFRYSLLYKLGGWWVDMDTVCLKPFDFKEDFVFSSEFSNPYNRILVNTTFIKTPPKTQLMKDCLSFFEKRGHEFIHWGELGVNLISRMIFRNGLGHYVKLPEVFCPVSGYDLDQLISDTEFSVPESSHAIHWWNELWKRRNINKNENLAEKSIFESLKKKYLQNN